MPLFVRVPSCARAKLKSTSSPSPTHPTTTLPCDDTRERRSPNSDVATVPANEEMKTIVGRGLVSTPAPGNAVGYQTVICQGANCGNGDRFEPRSIVDTLKGPVEEMTLLEKAGRKVENAIMMDVSSRSTLRRRPALPLRENISSTQRNKLTLQFNLMLSYFPL